MTWLNCRLLIQRNSLLSSPWTELEAFRQIWCQTKDQLLWRGLEEHVVVWISGVSWPDKTNRIPFQRVFHTILHIHFGTRSVQYGALSWYADNWARSVRWIRHGITHSYSIHGIYSGSGISASSGRDIFGSVPPERSVSDRRLPACHVTQSQIGLSDTNCEQWN